MTDKNQSSLRWKGLVVTAALLAIAACVPVEEPGTQPIGPAQTQTEEVVVEIETEEPLEPTEEETEENPGVTMVAPSGTVNLQELTPVPGTGENVVQPAPGVPDPAARIVPLAVADLAAMLGKSEAAITVVSATAVIWSDSSLGCPVEGMMYMQVLTSGYLVILESGGVQYPYHTNASGTVVTYCPNGQPPSVMPSDR